MPRPDQLESSEPVRGKVKTSRQLQYIQHHQAQALIKPFASAAYYYISLRCAKSALSNEILHLLAGGLPESTYRRRRTLQTPNMAFYEADSAWHAGEEEMHKLLRVPPMDNPTHQGLSPNAANTLIRSPLIALGALGEDGRIWTSIWGGEAGFSRAIAPGIIGMRTTVDRQYDPVLKVLLGDKCDGEVVQVKGTGKMVSALAINLETRSRVKLYGRMVAGALAATDDGIGEVQMVVKIEQSLGEC